jgi:competence protein ComEC
MAQWRAWGLAGATSGVAIAPFLDAPDPAGLGVVPTLALLIAAGIALGLSRPREGGGAGAIWAVLVVALAAGAGLVLGAERLAAIDAGALEAPDGARATARGFVTAVPRRSRGMVAVRVQTTDGRLLLEAPEPVPELPVGREVRASGTLREPPPWQESYLARFGIREVLAAGRIELTGRRRGGIAALTDRVRDRAEAALERGMPEPEAALARGFVLGQDDRIDAETVDDFKRSGLAHLLAVSGQNVLLLALLAVPVLATLNLSLRSRLLCVLALIAIYVPVTGAGPSIQRAGAMGAAGIVAALAGRPRSRWYAVLLAALATLAANPRASADVGWQLSFAAVVGILLWAEGIREWLLRRLHKPRDLLQAEHKPRDLLAVDRKPRDLLANRAPDSGWRRGLAEGAAVTIAATVATAPLMAYHFDSFSITALPANLLALPAVAPVMWLGMLVAIAGQFPFVPVEPLNSLNALLIGYIAQVSHWMAAPDWALADVGLPAPALLLTYPVLACTGWLARGAARRRIGLSGRGRAAPLLAVCALAFVLPLAASGPEGASQRAPGAPGLEVTVLDVGQGDAILLEPSDGEPVLVDGGPPGDDLDGRLDDEGVERLAAVAVTHDQLDHAGGVEELLGSVPVGSLAYSTASRGLLAGARAAGADPVRMARGDTIRSGGVRLEALWPPPGLSGRRGGPPGADPNQVSLVLVARWRRFSILLTGDAEAEAVPIDPGPVDALKIAHHGSEDAGLARLLERTTPGVAVISVGEGNPYGHPAPATTAALEEHEVPVLRTDRDGDVEIDVTPEGWTAAPE